MKNNNIKSAVHGFKVFNPDWTCRGFQYEVEKTYEMDGQPVCCKRGFHFCRKAADCFGYYSFDPHNKVAEVIAIGEVDSKNRKYCTNKIQIVQEIPWDEVLRIVNTGNWNTGNRNTGDWNKSSFNTGCFMTEEPKISMFNKPSDWPYKKWLRSDARNLLNQIPKNVVEWIYSEDMTDEEKEAYPTYETTGGYLKVLDESDCNQLWWDGLDDQQKDIIRSLPNFDAEIFEQCAGIRTEG